MRRPVLVLALACAVSAVQAAAEESEAESLFFEGADLVDEGRYLEAVDLLERSLKLDPDLCHPHYYIAEALVGIGTQKALSAAREATVTYMECAPIGTARDVGHLLRTLRVSVRERENARVRESTSKPASRQQRHRDQPRAIGFGGTVAGGGSSVCRFGDTHRFYSGAPAGSFDVAFEVRVFFRNTLSLDHQFDFGGAIADLHALGMHAVHYKLYLHFHVLPTTPTYFSVAPFLGFHAHEDGRGLVQLGSRVGIEIQSRPRTFSWGLYIRPAAVVPAFVSATPGGELLLELALFGYVLHPS